MMSSIGTTNQHQWITYNGRCQSRHVTMSTDKQELLHTEPINKKHTRL